VTHPRQGRARSVDIYDVAIVDAAIAIEAVRQASGAGPDAIVETIAELPIIDKPTSTSVYNNMLDVAQLDTSQTPTRRPRTTIPRHSVTGTHASSTAQ
jgi:hypothetical protein